MNIVKFILDDALKTQAVYLKSLGLNEAAHSLLSRKDELIENVLDQNHDEEVNYCESCKEEEGKHSDALDGVFCNSCKREALEFCYYLKSCPEGTVPATHLPEKIVNRLLEVCGRDEASNYIRGEE